MITTILAAQAAPPDAGLTLGEVLHNVPTNPAALFVYALVLGAVFLIWRGSRRPRSPSPGRSE